MRSSCFFLFGVADGVVGTDCVIGGTVEYLDGPADRGQSSDIGPSSSSSNAVSDIVNKMKDAMPQHLCASYFKTVRITIMVKNKPSGYK